MEKVKITEFHKNTDLGFRNEIIHGYSVSVLKSALQKYVRRCELKKGLIVLSILDSIRCFEIDKKHKWSTAAKRIRTNIINRMVVMISEEINISVNNQNISYFDYFKYLYTQWTNTREKEESSIYLIEFYKILCLSQKYRLISDLKTVYNLPPYYHANYNSLELLHEKLLTEFNLNVVKNVLYNEIVVDYNKDVTEFKKLLLKGDINCFTYLSRILASNLDNVKIPCDDILKEIKKMSDYQEYLQYFNALEFFYKKMTHEEKPIYLYNIILILLNKDKFCVEDILKYTPSDAEIKDHKNIVIPDSFELDDYVHDIHTGNKSKTSKTIVDFANEGAYVKNECKTFAIPLYRKMYVRFKEILEIFNKHKYLPMQINEIDYNVNDDRITSSKEGENTPIKKFINFITYYFYVKIEYLDQATLNKIMDLPHAQKLTAHHKKVVYVAKRYVYKGQYNPDDKTLVNTFKNLYALNELSDILNIKKTYLSPIALLITPQDKILIKYLNIGGGNVKEEDVEIFTTKVETNVKVIKRQTIIQRLIEEEKEHVPDESTIMDILKYLYMLYVAGIGDFGSHNILCANFATKGKEKYNIFGIDYEENRTAQFNIKKEMILDDILKKPSALQHKIYDKCMEKINEFHIKNIKKIQDFEKEIEPFITEFSHTIKKKIA